MSEPENRPETVTGELVRTEHGQFAPGHTGNRGGRPKMDPAVRAALEAQTMPAVQKLIEIMEGAEKTFVVGKGDNARLETAPDHDLQLRAAQALLDRSIGKPAQSIITTDDEGNPTAPIGIVFLPAPVKP